MNLKPPSPDYAHIALDSVKRMGFTEKDLKGIRTSLEGFTYVPVVIFFGAKPK